MENFNWYLGVDVSKNTLDITLLQGSKKLDYRQIENTIGAISQYLKVLKQEFGCKFKESLVCMEYTGIYNNLLLQVGHKKGLPIWLESAMQIKQSTGVSRIKNDKVDSEKIAVYAYRFKDKARLWSHASPTVNLLNQLSKQREKLLKVKHQLGVGQGDSKLFMDKSLSKMMAEVVKKPLEEVNKAIKVIDNKIKAVIQSDEQMHPLVKLITSVPGVGIVTAVKIVITTNEFKDINDPRKYACYGGIAPFERSSGTSIKGRPKVSKKANLSVKTILSMCANSAIQNDFEMKQFYERKVDEGKNKRSVLNAIRNKIIHRIFACVNQNRTYEKYYLNQLA
jgi:transposase